MVWILQSQNMKIQEEQPLNNGKQIKIMIVCWRNLTYYPL
nr:MAG TPA: hypothetical protein [Bacteriophage sp.]